MSRFILVLEVEGKKAIHFKGEIEMKNLSDELLIETLIKAILLGANTEFINLLEAEIRERGLDVETILADLDKKYDQKK